MHALLQMRSVLVRVGEPQRPTLACLAGPVYDDAGKAQLSCPVYRCPKPPASHPLQVLAGICEELVVFSEQLGGSACEAVGGGLLAYCTSQARRQGRHAPKPAGL